MVLKRNMCRIILQLIRLSGTNIIWYKKIWAEIHLKKKKKTPSTKALSCKDFVNMIQKHRCLFWAKALLE